MTIEVSSKDLNTPLIQKKGQQLLKEGWREDHYSFDTHNGSESNAKNATQPNTHHLHHQTSTTEPPNNVMVGARPMGSSTHLPNPNRGEPSEHFGTRPNLHIIDRQGEFGPRTRESRDEHMDGNSSDGWSDGDDHPHQLNGSGCLDMPNFSH